MFCFSVSRSGPVKQIRESATGFCPNQGNRLRRILPLSYTQHFNNLGLQVESCCLLTKAFFTECFNFISSLKIIAVDEWWTKVYDMHVTTLSLLANLLNNPWHSPKYEMKIVKWASIQVPRIRFACYFKTLYINCH